MSVATIQQNSRINLHFSLSMEVDGEKQTVDSTFSGKSAEFVLGDGNLPAGFEEYLIGLVTGDHKNVYGAS